MRVFSGTALFFVITFFPYFLETSAFPWQTTGKTTHFLKRISPGIFTTGRLTTRQLGYMSEAGYGSVLSLSNFAESTTTFNGMNGTWPSTTEASRIMGNYGTTFASMNGDLTPESFATFSSKMFSLPKPVLVESENGWMAALFSELYLAQMGGADIDDIFSSSLTLGYDFQSEQCAVDFVNSVTGKAFETSQASINFALANGAESYNTYYWTHRLGNDGWYNLGQILDTQVDAIAAAGYKAVISFRADGEATNRLSWQGQTGPVENGEFSDENGNLDISLENDAVISAGMAFYNLPVSGAGAYTKEQFNSYLPTFQEASSLGPVLVHCASGYRSVTYTLAYLASLAPEERCVDWAIKEARRVGESLDINESDIQQAVVFWRNTLAC